MLSPFLTSECLSEAAVASCPGRLLQAAHSSSLEQLLPPQDMGTVLSDQRLRTWANSTLISLPSFPLAQCIPDCAMTGGFRAPVPQEGCGGATTATRQPGWQLGAEHLSFHEPSTFTRQPLPQGFLPGAAELRFSLPGWFFEAVPFPRGRSSSIPGQ